jgi:excisionase family DNA binding protein
LGVSVETIKKMISAGSLEVVRLHPTAHPRVRRADVEALARGERPPSMAAP